MALWPPTWCCDGCLGSPAPQRTTAMGGGRKQRISVQSVKMASLSDQEVLACSTLWAKVFAKPGRTAESVAEERRREALEEGERHEVWHIVWAPGSSQEHRGRISKADKVAVAAARTFERRVKLGDGIQVTVLALAHVACDPDSRGMGLGTRLVDAALSWGKGNDRLALALFQTSVPQFYGKMGGMEITHEIINSTGNGSDAKRRSGFWDPHIMVYPASAAVSLPPGPIDLLGPGY